jgi:hypothetical protein
MITLQIGIEGELHFYSSFPGYTVFQGDQIALLNEEKYFFMEKIQLINDQGLKK